MSWVNLPDQDRRAAYIAVYYLLHAGLAAEAQWFTYDSAFGEMWTAAAGENKAALAYRHVAKWLSGATVATPFARTALANQIRTADASTAVAGTPGTLPTNWGFWYPDATHGITVQIVGTGTENGVPYLDWRIFGTADSTATGVAQIFFETSTQIASSVGDYWTLGLNARSVGGSYAGVNGLNLQFSENDSGGAWIASDIVSYFQPNGLSLDQQRFQGTARNNAGAKVRPLFQASYAKGVAIDLTLRIGAPTVDKGSVWSGVVTKSNPANYQAQIVWDAAGGPTSYNVPAGYSYSRDLDGNSNALGATVTLTNKPLILENAQWKGFAP